VPVRIEAVDSYVAGHWLFVAVVTEEGLIGAGESGYFTHPLAARAVVADLAEQIRGWDAFAPEFLFNRLLKHHCLRDSAFMGAVSAIDQALWDIKGKALGVPVWQLLGGRVREKVRAILLIEATDREGLLAGVVQARNEGFTAVKIKPFLGDWARRPTAAMFREVSETVLAAREAAGWEIDIAVEIHRNLTADLAAPFAEAIAPMRPYFIEDPILPFSTAGAIAAARAMAGTVALAERNTNIWEFREISDCHEVAILRPDVGLAGGFTQMRKIAAIAESRQQRIVPHNFTSPLITACHIQLAACTSNWDVQGYVREDRRPWTDVVRRINRLEDGFLLIPESPGIGLELDFDHLRTAAYEPFGGKFHHGVALGMDGGIRHQ
jgi:galactonate dehydratase